MSEKKETPGGAVGQVMDEATRNWVMVALTLIFVALYAAALTGWLRPLPDDRMVARLEPVIFVIIGYYFGRLPAAQTEKTLKGEIARQTDRADQAQQQKEQATQQNGALAEKVKNAKAVLAAAPPSDDESEVRLETLSRGSAPADGDAAAHAAAALRVLDS